MPNKNNNNLPKGWRKVKLGEIVENYISGDWGKEKPQGDFIIESYVIRGTDIPSLQIGDISTLQKRFIKKSSLEKRKLKEGDIIIEISGGSTDQPVGRPLFISRNLLDKLDKPIIYSNFCRRVRAKKEVNPIFLYFQLYMFYNSPEVYNFQIQSTGISNFHFADFLKYKEIILPDALTQKRIAEILSAFDEKIELNNKIIKTLEEIAQAIFKEWFVKFRFPGWEKVKFVNSELGKIPEGWEVGYLGDGVCSEIIKPGIKRFNGEKIYLATADVIETKIVNTSTKITYENRPIRANFQPILNSIWFAKMINTYKVLFFFEGNKEDIEKYILSTGFMGIKALRNMQYYLYLFINSKHFHQIKDTLVQGAVQEAITNTNVKEIKILIPPENLINKFNEEIEPLIIKIYKSKAENQKLSALRDLFLPKLMSPPREINI